MNWKTTDFEDIKVESLTGNAFFLDYHSPASYGTTIPREYTVVDVSIWTGTVDPSTGLPGRRNEYFNPLVPFDGAEYTNSAKSNGNNIVWKPINQQDTPGDLNGVITFDIMDEFGHTYRMKMDHTILMERSE